MSISQRSGVGWPRVAVAGVAVAALSLLVFRVPAYDPTAWLIWGREVSHGTLDMIGGPSWKPLPVGVTTLLSFAGDDAATWGWLAVARLGGLAALALVFVLARRLGGRTAGIIAAAGLALATDFLFNVVRGDSEGLLVALVTGAILLHLDERRHGAFAAGVLACGLRPEVWPLLGLYGLWLVREERRAATAAYVLAGGAVILAAWFVPDYLATGDWLRGAGRAKHPVPGSPGQSAFPFGFSLLLACGFLIWPLYAGAVAAVRADPRLRRLGAAAAALFVLVAVMAELGFTGNIRYQTLPGALTAVLGGVGLPGLMAAVRRRERLSLVLGVLAVAATLVSVGIVVTGAVRLVREERVMGGQLRAAIARAGGPARVRACGRVSTTPFERQMVAYRLHLLPRDVYTHAESPGIMFVRAGKRAAGADALPVRGRTGAWTIRTSCSLPAGK